jgi:arsenate reductase
MIKVLFVCMHNAGRSQMAAAFFNELADKEKARAISAGIKPATTVYLEALVAMQEIGIEIVHCVPQKMNYQSCSDARHVITFGCGDECPVVFGATTQDWFVGDPRGKPLERVREIRDEIKTQVEAFLTKHAWLKQEENV